MTRVVQHTAEIHWLNGSKERKGQPLFSSFRDKSFDFSNGMYEKFTTDTGHICNGLFSSGEDGSEPEEWAAFASYFEDIKTLQENFLCSQIIHVSRTQNHKADSLARSARKELYFIVHMDAEPHFGAVNMSLFVLLMAKK